MSLPSSELHRAILQGKLERVRELIYAGVEFHEIIDASKAFPLELAIREGQSEIAKFLLERGADPNEQRTQFQQSMLHLAAGEGRLEIVRALLAAGASLQLLDHAGMTPFDSVCCYEGSKAGLIVKELIPLGGDPHRVSRTWGTPLIKASWRGHISAVRELLRNGADPNYMSQNGTPLIVAIDNGRADVAIELRLQGADPLLRYEAEEAPGNKSCRGKTPLEYAQQLKKKKLIPLLMASLDELRSLAAPPPATVADIPKLWKQIEKFAKKISPTIKKSLCKPATEEEMAAVEHACGCVLPADVRASWAIHDGQQEDAAEESLVPEDWLDSPYELLSIANITREWKMWTELLDGGEFEGQQVTPDDGVRASWWNRGWIPLAQNGSGDLLCLDLVPSEQGRAGQVIEMRHDAETRRLVARSFADFLRELADRLEAAASE